MKIHILSLLLVLTLNVVVQSADAPFVIDFYMESLCPYCVQFTTRSLKNFFAREGNEELAIINFVPYGNAKEAQRADGTFQFTCQHGEPECQGNLIETCAVNVLDRTSANSFIVCLESTYSGDFNAAKDKCLAHDQDSKSVIDQCLASEAANALEHEMAQKTNSLQPPHRWVPWVVVDGAHDDKITDVADLVEYLCKKRSDRNELQICNSKIQYTHSVQLRFLSELPVCFRQ